MFKRVFFVSLILSFTSFYDFGLSGELTAPETSVELLAESISAINHLQFQEELNSDLSNGILGDLFTEGESPDDIYWESGYNLPGLDHWVRASVIYKDLLIVGGSFLHADDERVDYLAAWDGKDWSAFGNANGGISCLFENEGNLYVAGAFDEIAGVSANRIAMWNGQEWLPLGGGIDGTVYSMIIYNGMLVCGGYFTNVDGMEINDIASWDGSAWHAFTDQNFNGSIRDMEAFGEQLVVGGDFDSIGTMPASCIASWDGTSWNALGQGLTRLDSSHPSLNCITKYQDKIFIGGHFQYAGGIDAERLAMWDGSAWQGISPGPNSTPMCMQVNDGKLYIGGYFTKIAGIDANNVAVYDGTVWSTLKNGLVRDLAEGIAEVSTISFYQGNVIVAGRFYGTKGGRGDHIRQFDGMDWYPVTYDQGMGVNSEVLAFGIYNDKLAVGGYFSGIGEQAADALMFLEDNKWMPVDPNFSGSVDHIIEYQNMLYISCGYANSDGVSFYDLGYWDGSSWTSLDDKIDAIGTSSSPYIYDMAIFDGKLIIAGRFEVTGVPSIYNIAAWDGSEWTSLGTDSLGYVYSLLVHDGKLYAATRLMLENEPDRNFSVAAWDGETWSGVGSNYIGVPDDIDLYQGQLYICGTLGYRDDDGYHRFTLAKLANNVWSAIPQYPSSPNSPQSVELLEVHNGLLYVGGRFQEAGGVTANNMVAWDGYQWLGLGSGIVPLETFANSVSALYGYNDKLYVGGDFPIAGNKASASIAVWNAPARKIVCLDIKPGSCTNPLNLKGKNDADKAVVPVAIIGSNDFDVEDIDLSTLRLAGTSPIRCSYEDIAAYTEDITTGYNCEEAVPDGITDLSMKFYRNSLAEYIGNLPDDTSYVLALSGYLTDGTMITGYDRVSARPNGDCNGDGTCNIADAGSIINKIFNGSSQNLDEWAGDVNCDGMFNVADASYIINYIFFGGPAPCSGS